MWFALMRLFKYDFADPSLLHFAYRSVDIVSTHPCNLSLLWLVKAIHSFMQKVIEILGLRETLHKSFSLHSSPFAFSQDRMITRSEGGGGTIHEIASTISQFSPTNLSRLLICAYITFFSPVDHVNSAIFVQRQTEKESSKCRVGLVHWMYLNIAWSHAWITTDPWFWTTKKILRDLLSNILATWCFLHEVWVLHSPRTTH